MINVDIIKINSNNNWLFVINIWITIHFGKNPKKGGRPPNDSKFKNKINFIVFEFINKENNWFIWETLKVLKIKIKAKEKKVYSKKYNNQNKLFINIEEIIHPKWLIEEYASNFRKDVWFKPPIAPIIAERIILIIKKLDKE